MGRALVEAGQHRPGPRRHLGGRVALTGEGANPLQRVEQQDGDELHLAAEVTPQQVGAVIAVQVTRCDARQDLLADDLLVGVGILPAARR